MVTTSSTTRTRSPDSPGRAGPAARARVVVRHPLQPFDARNFTPGALGVLGPFSFDGVELAVRAVLGQQVTVAGARTLAARLTAGHGTPLPVPDGEITHLFPSAEDLAAGKRTKVMLRKVGRYVA